MLTKDRFLSEIDIFLSRSGMSASAFGKAAVGDPNFVKDVREGRHPNLRLVGRVADFIRDYSPPEQAGAA